MIKNHFQSHTSEPRFIPDDISQIEQPDQAQNIQPLSTNPIENLQTDQQQIRYQQSKYRNHRFGALHIKYILFVFIPLIVGVCFYTYHQAVKKKQEKPFPHSSISDTASHYIQNIPFRLIWLSALSFMHLVYFIIFKWIKMIVKRTKYPGENLSWLYPVAQISIIAFFPTIGTIDGQGYPEIHTIGAVFFFIVFYFMQLNVTVLIRDIYKWDPSSISYFSKTLKTILIAVLTILFGYFLYGILFDSKNNFKYVVIMQWNLVIWGFVWILTFASDWSRVFLTLKGNFKNTVKLSE